MFMLVRDYGRATVLIGLRSDHQTFAMPTKDFETSLHRPIARPSQHR